MSKSISPPSISRIHTRTILFIASLQLLPGMFVMLSWYGTLVRASLPVPSNIPCLPFLITLGAGTTLSSTLIAHVLSSPRWIYWVAYTLTNLFTAIALPCILSRYLDWEGIRILFREGKTSFIVFVALFLSFVCIGSQLAIDSEIVATEVSRDDPSPEDTCTGARPMHENATQSSATHGLPLSDSETEDRLSSE